MRNGKERIAPGIVVSSLLLWIVLLVSPPPLLAITATTLTYGSVGSASTDYTTNEITPEPNALILAWVIGSNKLQTPTLSGNGLTWVEVVPTSGPYPVDYFTVGSPSLRISLFRAMGTSPSRQGVTIHFGQAVDNCVWSIVQFSGVDSSGSNGSGAVLQAVSAYKSSGSSLTINLQPLGAAANASAGAFSDSYAGDDALTAGAGYSASPMAYTTSPNYSLMAEWRIPGNTVVNAIARSSLHLGAIAVEIKGATTVVGNGSDPEAATIAPGGAPTMADSFTFQTNMGTATVSDITVSLSAGSAARIATVEITDDSGSTVYGSVNTPASDTPKVILTSPISVTTTAASYKIRITPKGHAEMPAPPGGSYAVTALVSNWTDGNNHGGFDSGGTTVTIDNQSPANVTAASVAPAESQVTVYWTNPGDADLGKIVVLRRTGSAVSDTPVEGASYLAGDTVGSSTIACAVSSPGATCTDTGLTNGTSYYYKIFARDTRGNYSVNGVTPGGPSGMATPQRYQPDVMIKLATEDATGYLADNGYESTATTQAKALGVLTGLTAIYHLKLQNDATTTDDLVVKGEGSGSNFTVQYLDESLVDRTAEITSQSGYTIPGLAIGAFREWTLKVTPNKNATPVTGGTSYQVLVTATSHMNSAKKDQVKAVTTSTSANLTLLQSADKASYQPEEDITYSVIASNGASLTPASGVEVIYPVPVHTGLKVGSASFNPGSSSVASAVKYYYNGSWEYLPQSGNCSAPAGYDYCVTQVKWLMTGSMPSSTSFTCTMVVRVK